MGGRMRSEGKANFCLFKILVPTCTYRHDLDQQQEGKGGTREEEGKSIDQQWQGEGGA